MFRKVVLFFSIVCVSAVCMATPVGAVGPLPEPSAINCDTGGAEPGHPGWPLLGEAFQCPKESSRGVSVTWYGNKLPGSLTLTVTYDHAPDMCNAFWDYHNDTFDGIQGTCTLDGKTATVSFAQIPSIPDNQTASLDITNFSTATSPPFTAVVDGTLYDPGGGGGTTATIEDNVQTITDSVNADTEANDNIENQDTTGDDYTVNSDHNQSLLTFLKSTIDQLATVKPAPNCRFDIPYPTQIDPEGTSAWGVNACAYDPPGVWTTALSALAAFFWVGAVYRLLVNVLELNKEALS